MNFLVNAVSLRVAGGLSVATNFIRAVGAMDHCPGLDCLVPPIRDYAVLATPAVRIHPIPAYLGKPYLRFYLDDFWIPGKAREFAADAIFSMGNFAVPTTLPQLVLLQWSYAVYPRDPVWRQMSFQGRILRWLRLRRFRQTLGYATAIAVQTETVRRRLLAQYPVPADRVFIVPNAVSLPAAAADSERWSELRQRFPDKKLLLCLSRYYSHKNLEVLVEVAKLIHAANAPFIIIITVSGSQDPAAPNLLRNIQALGSDSAILNIGPVDMVDVPSLYRTVDGLILPTLLESFSGTFVEAMYYQIPIFTSDLDFAHDVCQDSAFYFDPLDPHDILAVVQRAFANDEDRNEHVRRGSEIVRKMPDWSAVSQQVLDLLQEIAGGQIGRQL